MINVKGKSLQRVIHSIHELRSWLWTDTCAHDARANDIRCHVNRKYGISDIHIVMYTIVHVDDSWWPGFSTAWYSVFKIFVKCIRVGRNVMYEAIYIIHTKIYTVKNKLGVCGIEIAKDIFEMHIHTELYVKIIN